MSKKLNPFVLAQTITEIQQEMGKDLAMAALKMVRGSVPKDAEITTALGMLCVAAGRLHAEFLWNKELMPPDNVREHIKECDKCLKEAAEIFVHYPLRPNTSLPVIATGMMTEGATDYLKEKSRKPKKADVKIPGVKE